MTEIELRASYRRAMRVIDTLEPTPPQPARRRLATGSQHPPFEIGPDEDTLVEAQPAARSGAAPLKLALPPPIPAVARTRAPAPDSIDSLTARVQLPETTRPAIARAVRRRSDKILRFVLAERLLHWALAIPFLICLASAAALLLYFNPDPTRPHREIVSWIHKVSGICFIGLPLGVLLASPRYVGVFWENIKEGWIWTKRDIKWIALKPFAVLFRRIELPEEGKFNAGEKLNFMWTMGSWPLYAATGLAIWLGGAFSPLGVYPWLIHLGLVAISLPLLLGHIFMAVVNPSTRKGLSGMTSGMVDRSWAKHHYRRWYKEKFGRAVTAAAPRRHGRARTGSVMIDIGRKISPATIALFLLLAGGGVAAGVYYSGVGIPAPTVSDEKAFYMGSDAALLGAASENADAVAGGPIVRGSAVEKLRDARDFAFVRDARGRTGYVFADDLFRERPHFDLAAFSTDACGWAAGETDAGGCRLRADEKRALCEVECEADADGACRDQCAAGHQSCAAQCDAGEDDEDAKR